VGHTLHDAPFRAEVADSLGTDAASAEGFAPVEEFVRSFWTSRLRALKDDIESKK
jgi:hypothetical protein